VENKLRDKRVMPYLWEKRHQGKYLLLLGLARSGTSFCSSLLGGHPDINMLCESYGSAILRGVGKLYNGNKLCAHQIKYNLIDKAPVRLVKSRKLVSRLFFQDYADLGAKTIIIRRNTEDVANSMVKRTNCSYKSAYEVIEDGTKFLDDVNKHNEILPVSYDNLCDFKEDVLKEICEYLELEYSPRMLAGEKYNWVYPDRKKT
jgi:hypothetical protein